MNTAHTSQSRPAESLAQGEPSTPSTPSTPSRDERNVDGEQETLQELTVTHRFRTVAGVRWHWVEVGSGEPIVFLHGFPESWYGWRHQLPTLARHHRLFVFDLKGFGQSDRSSRRPSDYHPLRVAEELLLLFDRLKLCYFNLVAHSRGSVVADYIAGTRPARVLRYARLQQAADVADLPGPPSRARLESHGETVERFRAPHLVRNTYAQLCKQSIPEEEIARAEQEFHHPGIAECAPLYLQARKPLTSWEAELADRAELFARMTLPVALIQGDSAPRQPASHFVNSASYLPAATTSFIADCGHFSHLEQPRAVGDAIRQLLLGPIHS